MKITCTKTLEFRNRRVANEGEEYDITADLKDGKVIGYSIETQFGYGYWQVGDPSLEAHFDTSVLSEVVAVEKEEDKADSITDKIKNGFGKILDIFG